MPVEVDFLSYHRSIAQELKATQNRVRDLIGSSHWQTEGEHKEAVLRKTLRSHLPESLLVGRGFVSYRHRTSTQLDILILSRARPTLFKDGDLVVVTPDAVRALIEVKTEISTSKLVLALRKLADEVERMADSAASCWSGLFAYDSGIKSEDLLRALHLASQGENSRAINCVALGPDCFARFWPRGMQDVDSPVTGAVWHAYEFTDENSGLAHAYFLNNMIWGLSPAPPSDMQYAWFPIRGGKEMYRRYYVALGEGEVTPFPEQ